MKIPNLPNGEDRVDLGVKTKKGEREGFAMHTPGTHTESEYAELGKSPSQKKALKPNIHKESQGGSNA
jgi:hypothetical protein